MTVERRRRNNVPRRGGTASECALRGAGRPQHVLRAYRRAGRRTSVSGVRRGKSRRCSPTAPSSSSVVYCRPSSRCFSHGFYLVFPHRVATGNPVVFTLSPPECYMEIRYGYGTTGNRVGGPVRVGDPLTLIIYMRSKYGKSRARTRRS